MKKLKNILISIFVSTSAVSTAMAQFYDNQYINRSSITLAAFDIDTSFQIDPNLIEMHEKTTGARWTHFVNSFDKGYDYIPILKQMLVDEGVPQEFLYLAMAESEFSTRAYSRKKASGIWQIMPETGRSLGLKIDDFIDERRDPIKSTQAAIKYLKSLREKTGKWYLAAMAYNCGIGRLQRAIDAAGSDDIEVLMDEEKKYIPQETRDYIRKILSMNVAFNDIDVLKSEEKEHFLNRGMTTSIASVSVSAGTSLDSIAKGAGLHLNDLKKYNRQFKFNFVPLAKGDYNVYLPYENLLSFKKNFKAQKVDLNNYIVKYSVQKGDNLFRIAKKYNTSVASIKSMNNLSKNNIRVNQKLLIPMATGYKVANNSKKKD